MKLYHLKFKKYHINLSNKKNNFSRISLIKLSLVNEMSKVYWRISLLCGILGLFPGVFIGLLLPFGIYYLPVAAIIFGVIGNYLGDSEFLSLVGIALGFIGLHTSSFLALIIFLSIYD